MGFHIMAFCTNCGAIFHEEDMEKHICKIENLPVKNKEKIPTTTEKSI